ncbi:hypothetical protein GCM10011351_08710 [Paraliobacillus quinghaiensis]|uniref:Uncharacterized protein n=1 Tax=Paraliobacillus quinghaiensis TaxID=470815 RepID=A0A917TK70_9BACI|nr:hypothetical protein [Paraliobacillus quinghaiensis]GGM25241.1 hypothetical protein GCM10011351_08710 [Paraliobacillus quinghaiensis]
MRVEHSQLIKAKENIRSLEKLERELVKIDQEHNELELKEKRYHKKLMEEKVDVERLEGISVTGIFTTLIGKKQEKLTKEKREVAEAQLKYQEAKQSKAETRQELEEIKEKMQALGNPKETYEHLLKQKQQEIVAETSETGVKLLELDDTIADLKSNKKEMEEAFVAGQQAKHALSEALTSLDKAKNWGTVDMFGGGFITTTIKHGKIDDASREVHQAQSLLRKFSRELDDIGQQFNADLSISGGLTFMDYFFDGIISDWLVQDEINHSIEKVENIYQQTNDTLVKLEKLIEETYNTLKLMNERWERLILTILGENSSTSYGV